MVNQVEIEAEVELLYLNLSLCLKHHDMIAKLLLENRKMLYPA